MSYFVMYLRKSRADAEAEKRGRFETLAEHERQLTALCRERGLEVAEIYKELVSGESIAERAEFQKVLERVKDKDCAGIVCHAVDRLGRGDPMEYGYVLSTLRFNGCKIVTPSKTFDTANIADIQHLKLQMFVSNIEFDHIRERLHDGSRRSVENGCYIGSHAPYGYDKARIDGRPSLVPNEEADAVRLMYKLACEGLDKGKIARKLNSDGIKTKTGKAWTAQRVGATLSNPIYKGCLRWGYTRVVQRNVNGLIVKARDSSHEDMTLHRGLHKPLVDADTWERANASAFASSPVPNDMTIKNPFAGLLYCGKCGRALVRQLTKNSGKKYERLHHAYNTDCQIKSIALDYVMHELVSALLAIADDMEIQAVQVPDTTELDYVNRAIDSESSKLDKLLELFYADAIDIEEFKTRRAESAALVAELRSRRDILTASANTTYKMVSTVHEVIRLLEDDSVPPDAKNTALRMLISRIDYFEIDRATKNRNIRLVVTLN